jgi:TldD protein
MKLTRVIVIGTVAATLLGVVGVRASSLGGAEATSIPTAGHPAGSGDALVDALLTELGRSKAQLKMDQLAPPYYIEYRVSDVDDYTAEAAFGALRENQRVRYRILRVVVRLGDYKQDSYYGQGMGETNILPLDEDPLALRHQIWLATDDAYKAAGQALTEKQAALKQFSAENNPVDDFSKVPVVTDLQPTVNLQVDERQWKQTLQDVSNLYRQ